MRSQPADLFHLGLQRALRESGCPICRLREESEVRYTRFLLWEPVNDATTRRRLHQSLGFCDTHTWQVGQMEVASYGDALGNSAIYEDLVGRVRVQPDRFLNLRRIKRKPTWGLGF